MQTPNHSGSTPIVFSFMSHTTKQLLCLFVMVFLLAVSLSSRLQAFEAKRLLKGERTYAVNFDEADAKQILALAGLTNQYVYHIERDSAGLAVFAHFEALRGEKRGALLMGQSGVVV